METGINLLPEIAEKEISQGVYKRKINVVALGALLITGLIVVGLFVYQFILTASANDIQTKTTDAEKVVSQYSDLEIKNQAVKEKLDKIRTLLDQAIPGSSAVSEVKKDVDQKPITLKGVGLTDASIVTVEGNTKSSQALSDYIDAVKTGSGKDAFEKITLVSFTGNNNNDGYDFSFSMHYKPKGLKQ